jgi:hypothetical protein
VPRSQFTVWETFLESFKVNFEVWVNYFMFSVFSFSVLLGVGDLLA